MESDETCEKCHRQLHTYMDPEELTHWYLRLNGFMTVENFILHRDNG